MSGENAQASKTMVQQTLEAIRRDGKESVQHIVFLKMKNNTPLRFFIPGKAEQIPNLFRLSFKLLHFVLSGVGDCTGWGEHRGQMISVASWSTQCTGRQLPFSLK